MKSANRQVPPAFPFCLLYLLKLKLHYEFQIKDSSLMYMAGIYNSLQKDGDVQAHFTIFTRGANISIADIHDRMPVLIYKNEIKDWLNDFQFVDFAFHRTNHAFFAETLPNFSLHLHNIRICYNISYANIQKGGKQRA